MKKVLIINGPNLNKLEYRDATLYNGQPFDAFLNSLKKRYKDTVTIQDFQSSYEGGIIDRLHTLLDAPLDGLIINAGALSHTSLAIHDALEMLQMPVVEVHLSNIYAREEFRNYSYVSRACKGVISGLGLHGYELALVHLLSK